MFNILTKLLFILLPFHVLFSVFFQYKVGIPGFTIYKELILVLLTCGLGYGFYKAKKKPTFDKLDYLIFAYFGYLVLVTFFAQWWLKSIFFWARYDFEFFLAFLLMKHGKIFLQKPIQYYVKLFLLSGWLALILWLLVRFVFKETILLNFGFSGNVSVWNYGQSVPIYHWVEWATVRRFQGIFDWPNQAAYFILVYIWTLLYYFRNDKDYQFLSWCIVFILLWVLLFTYSRSALLWFAWGAVVVALLNIKTLFKKYLLQVIVVMIPVIILSWAFYYKYNWGGERLIARDWSSKWHIERIMIGVDRFTKNPIWSWLASSWPASRSVHKVETKEQTDYYIPESWFVQQLVEWWVIWFVIFGLILLLIIIELYKKNTFLLWSFMSVLTMNLVLHTFEAMYISIIFFMILGLVIWKSGKSNKKLW